ncbi:MAG: protein kinase [Prochloraceae cyanobacterium]|nr:protein kinase [Prochloraceae cyanobacterium]
MRCLNCGRDGISISATVCPHDDCGSHLPTLMRDCLSNGTILESKYHLDYPLGRGGFGITYRAMHVKTNQMVAIKEYYPLDYACRETKNKNLTIISTKKEEFEWGKNKFLKEAQTLARLEHQNIVRVQDYFEANNTAYIVMELVRGHTLKKELESLDSGFLSVLKIKDIYNALIEALDITHQAQIYHLDIKPDNIIITTDGTIKLVDFGAAKQGMGTAKNQACTPEYAPPEVLFGKEIGPQSDIFELGVMLHELLIGKRPLDADKRLIKEEMLKESLNLTFFDEPWRTLLEAALHLDTSKRPENVKKWWELSGILSCPYVGLSAFKEENSKYFFGREKFSQLVVKKVAEKNFIAIVGASGSGKSSLVFAGVVPLIRKTGIFVIESFRPQNKPFENLAKSLVKILAPDLEKEKKESYIERISTQLKTGKLKLEKIARKIAAQYDTKLLLIIDQFEELYTLNSEKNIENKFINQLLQAVNRDACQILLTLRADFLGYSISYRPWADALQESYLTLSLMNSDELKEVIEKPAGLMGVQLEDGLSERILKAVTSSTEKLPLLEFALTLLWSKQKKGFVTHKAYEEIGGVEKALTIHAERVYCELSTEYHKKVAQQIFLQLIHINEGTTATRRIASFDEIKDWNLVSYLADRRLVVTNRDVSLAGMETVELVHEALIRNWARFKQWIEVDRAFRIWQDRLRQSLKIWLDTEGDRGAYLRGLQLVEAREWLGNREADLSSREVEYIRASIELAEQELKQEQERVKRELEQEKKSRRQLQIGIAVSSVMAIIATGLGFLANHQRLEAELNQVDSLARSSLFLFNEGQQLEACLASIQAGKILQKYQTNDTELLSALLTSSYRGCPFNQIQLPLNQIYDYNNVSFSPDGKTLAFSNQNTIKVWDLETASEIFSFQDKLIDRINYIRFSPDGRTLAFSSENMIKLWDLKAQRELNTFQDESTNYFRGIAFSPDGKKLASFNVDNFQAIIWDLETRSKITLDGLPTDGSFTLGAGNDLKLNFSADSKILSFADEHSQRIVLWDLANRSQISNFTVPVDSYGHDVVGFINFSPDLQTLAFIARNGNFKLWNPKTNQEILDFPEVECGFNTFSNDSKTLASICGENTLLLWDLDSKKQIASFKLPLDTPTVAINFSPDDNILTAVNQNGAVISWNLKQQSKNFTERTNLNSSNLNISFNPYGKSFRFNLGGEDFNLRVEEILTSEFVSSEYNPIVNSRVKQILTSQENDFPIQILSFSPDGKILAIGKYQGSSDNPVIKLSDLASKKEIITLDEDISRIASLSFSSDSKILASADNDGVIKLWNLETKQAISGFDFLRGFSVSFSPDGKLVTGDPDGTIKVWNLKRKEPLLSIQGHQRGIQNFTFTPDGKIMVSSNKDWGAFNSEYNTIKIWNLETGRKIFTLERTKNQINFITFTDDGKSILSVSDKGEVKYWRLDLDSLIKLSCNRLKFYFNYNTQADPRVCHHQ